MKNYYPLNLDIENKKCVVVGGGKVAFRKVKSLLKYKAKVYLIAPKITPKIKELAKENKIKLCAQNYSAKYLRNAQLVFGAVNNHALNKKIYRDALKRKTLVNIVDNPKLCTFIVPASFQRGPINISISTSGTSPALAKKIRLDLEKIINRKYSELLRLLSKLREEFKKKFSRKKREKIWRKFLNLDIQRLLKLKKINALKLKLKRLAMSFKKQ